MFNRKRIDILSIKAMKFSSQFRFLFGLTRGLLSTLIVIFLGAAGQAKIPDDCKAVVEQIKAIEKQQNHCVKDEDCKTYEWPKNSYDCYRFANKRADPSEHQSLIEKNRIRCGFPLMECLVPPAGVQCEKGLCVGLDKPDQDRKPKSSKAQCQVQSKQYLFEDIISESIRSKNKEVLLSRSLIQIDACEYNIPLNELKPTSPVETALVSYYSFLKNRNETAFLEFFTNEDKKRGQKLYKIFFSHMQKRGIDWSKTQLVRAVHMPNKSYFLLQTSIQRKGKKGFSYNIQGFEKKASRYMYLPPKPASSNQNDRVSVLLGKFDGMKKTVASDKHPIATTHKLQLIDEAPIYFHFNVLSQQSNRFQSIMKWYNETLGHLATLQKDAFLQNVKPKKHWVNVFDEVADPAKHAVDVKQWQTCKSMAALDLHPLYVIYCEDRAPLEPFIRLLWQNGRYYWINQNSMDFANRLYKHPELIKGAKQTPAFKELRK